MPLIQAAKRPRMAVKHAYMIYEFQYFHVVSEFEQQYDAENGTSFLLVFKLFYLFLLFILSQPYS